MCIHPCAFFRTFKKIIFFEKKFKILKNVSYVLRWFFRWNIFPRTTYAPDFVVKKCKHTDRKSHRKYLISQKIFKKGTEIIYTSSVFNREEVYILLVATQRLPFLKNIFFNIKKGRFFIKLNMWPSYFSWKNTFRGFEITVRKYFLPKNFLRKMF